MKTKLFALVVATALVGHAADTTNPTITDLLPANGASAVDGGQLITASVSDDVGIDAGSVILVINGEEVGATYDTESASVSWQPSSVLPNGAVRLTLSVADTAGNVATASSSYTVVNAFRIYGGAADEGSGAVSITGGATSIEGNVFSASDIEISGADCSVNGTVKAVGQVTIADSAGIPTAQQGVPAESSLGLQAEDIRTRANFNHRGLLLVTAEKPLAAGIHSVVGDVRIRSSITVAATIVATGRIIVEADDVHLTAAHASDVVLFGEEGVEVKGASNSFVGCLVSINDSISISGSGSTFLGNGRRAGIWGRTVSISGSNCSFGGSDQ